MALVSLPNTLANGTPQDGSQVYANDVAIVAAVNALDNNNIASGANIDCAKLSTTVGQQIVAGNIKDGEITAAKLRADAGTGSAGAAIASANNIVDAIINGKKLKNTTVGSDKLEILTYSVLLSTLLGQNTLTPGTSRVASVSNVPDVAGTGTLDKTQLVPVGCSIEVSKASGVLTGTDNLPIVNELSRSQDNKIYFLVTGNWGAVDWNVSSWWTGKSAIDLTLVTLKFSYIQIAST